MTGQFGQVIPLQVINLLFHVECFVTVIPKVYSGPGLMNIDCKDQSDKSVWSIYILFDVCNVYVLLAKEDSRTTDSWPVEIHSIHTEFTY